MSAEELKLVKIVGLSIGVLEGIAIQTSDERLKASIAKCIEMIKREAA
jgi:hypothetical protein